MVFNYKIHSVLGQKGRLLHGCFSDVWLLGPNATPFPQTVKKPQSPLLSRLFYINLWYKGNKKLSYQRVTQTSRRVLKLINPQMCWAHATVWGEKVQVSKGEEIRCFEPLLHGQDYVAKVVTINQYVQSLKWLFNQHWEMVILDDVWGDLIIL